MLKTVVVFQLTSNGFEAGANEHELERPRWLSINETELTNYFVYPHYSFTITAVVVVRPSSSTGRARLRLIENVHPHLWVSLFEIDNALKDATPLAS